jgi:predicted RNase H-like nuclease (RuvC/YqgF family)
MSHDAEMDAAMARIGVLRYRLEHAEIDKAHLKVELTDLKSTADRFEVENSILMNETARLLAEMDSLMTNPTSRLLRVERDENARLKAEVERLEKTEEYLQNTLNQYALDDMRLQAQVERLTKAGDEMALNLTHIGWNICVEAWLAAKEGKQS